MASEKFNTQITISGSAADIALAKTYLSELELTGVEAKDRLMIMETITTDKLNASILYDGNTVWNETKLLRNLRSMVRSNNMNLMTKYTYDFFHLSCGSIAHTNKDGWLNEYPTIASLRQFFHSNEIFGISVLAHQPIWKTDAIHIVKEMNKILRVKG